MKKLLFNILAILFIAANSASAQVPKYYKDGINRYRNRTVLPQGNAHTQLLYAPGDFDVVPASGSITKLYLRNFYFEIAGSSSNATGFDLSLGQTTATQFSGGTFFTGLTSVLSGSPFTINNTQVSSEGWLEFTLTTPFTYDNTKTLIVDIKTTGVGTQVLTWSDSVANNKTCYSQTLAATTGTVTPYWNHFGMNIAATSACNGAPSAGQVSWKKAGICSSNSYNLDVVGSSGGTSISYQWQTSSTQTGPYSNIGTASSNSAYTATVTGTVWYRAAVSCGSNVSYTPAVQLNANNYLPAGTYTLNSGLPTAGTNFKNVNAFAAALECGIAGPVTLNVTPNSGIYFEQTILPPVPNTSATNKITINGNGNYFEYRLFNQVSPNRSVMQINGTDYLTIDSVEAVLFYDSTIYNNNFYNYSNSVFQIRNDANNVTIKRSIIGSQDSMAYYYNNNAAYWNNNGGVYVTELTNSTSYSYALLATACDSITVENNRFYNTTINIWGNTAPNQTVGHKVLNNVMLNNYNNNYYYNYNFATIGLNGVNNTLVEGNNIRNPRAYSIQTDVTTSNARIARNKIWTDSGYNYNTNYGYWNRVLLSGANITFVNNLIRYSNYYYSSTYLLLLQNLDSAMVAHNTLVMDSSSYGSPNNYIYYGVYYNASQKVYFRDNIISLNPNLNINSQYSTLLYMVDTIGFKANNNNYYAPNMNIARVGGTYLPTINMWRSYTGQDLASDTLNPNFFYPQALDYRPTRMALDNRGIPIPGVTNDLVGITRNPTNPDMGAFEFGLITCDSPLNVTVSNITPISAHFKWDTVKNNTGYLYIVDQNSAAPASSTGATYTPDTACNITGLQPYTTYYFHVRTNCGYLRSGWATVAFTTACVTPPDTITNNAIMPLCYGAKTVLHVSKGSNLTYQWKRNNTNIPGATLDSLVVTQAGNYTVEVKMGTCSNLSDVITVTYLQQPTVTANGSTTICQGSNVVLSTQSVTGYNYQWQLNGGNIPGATSASYTATLAGNYRVLVTTPMCNDTSTATLVTVVQYPTNTITPTDTISFCDQASTRVTATQNANYTYQWYKGGTAIVGATNYFYDITTTGMYHVAITNRNVCTVASDTITADVIALPIATADAVGNTVFCNTGTVFIRSTQGAGYTYQWYRNGTAIPGATGDTYTATQDGVYTVMVNNGRCSNASAALQVVFNAYPRPAIVNNAGTLHTVDPYATYQWNKNGLPIPFANARDYTPTVDGHYVVVVGDTSGCLGSSNVITINSLSVDGKNSANGITVYPNPTKGNLYIQANTGSSISVSLTSVDGRVVLPVTKYTTAIDMTQFAEGVYILKVMDNAGLLIHTQQVVKIKE